MKRSHLRSTCVILSSMVIGFAVTMPVFAESAPVFDADNMQQDLDASNDQQQDYPMPPPPGQENTYFSAQGNLPQGNSVAAGPAVVPGVAPAATDQRVRRLEDQVKHLETDSSSARVESLQHEVQTLRGQVEELTHQLQQAQSQQKAMYTDLDKRVAMNKEETPSVPADTSDAAASSNDVIIPPPAKKPTRSNATKIAAAKAQPVDKPTTAVTAPPQPNVAEEQQIYQTAYNLIKSKKYNEAVNALQGMLKKYPTGQFASNAHYWLGELYGLLGKNDQALTEFSTVVKNYPSSPRVSDAQLKIGLIYAAQVKWSEAKAAFKKVINQYPGSASAKLAAAQLKQMKDDNH